MSLWRYSNPAEFMRLTAPALPVLWALTGLSLAVGLGWGFFLTPDDYQQGATVKILFIHVPAALMAINAWLMMLVASLVWFIRRHHVSALAARAAAPVGATMTLIALATGAIWGEPMWGTWWAWDPRLTSFFVLFLFYVGYMALWEAVDEPDKAADLAAIVCLVGSVFALLSRYAVFFWAKGCTRGRRSRSTRARTWTTPSGGRSSSPWRASCCFSSASSWCAPAPRSGSGGCGRSRRWRRGGDARPRALCRHGDRSLRA